jgi:cytochrome c-type biogenesis protein CcmH/NrfF
LKRLVQPKVLQPVKNDNDVESARPLRRSVVLLVALLLLWAAPAFAQGCAMCYSSASAASKDGQKAISKGVAVLVAPPLGVLTLGVGLAFRYGRKRDQEQNRDDDSIPL